MKFAPPLPLKKKYYKAIEQEINRLFYEVIYRQLIRALQMPAGGINNSPNRINSHWRARYREVMNSQTALEAAIRSGKVYFEDGLFKGKFNSHTSKALRAIGASFNPKSKTWSFKGVLPPVLSIARADAESRFTALKRSLVSALDGIDPTLIDGISDIPDLFTRTVDEMEDEYQKAVKSITITPRLTAAQRGIMTAEYSMSLDKYIKDWIGENVLELRGIVEKNALAGQRSGALVQLIQENYAVSKRKAEFLARQETSLFMSKFREARYKAIGSSRYKWSGSMDEREREDHRLLEGKIFSWDSPPVTNLKTGARNHPGEDFGCRCLAIPVFD